MATTMEHRKEQLLARRAELSDRLDGIERDLDQPHSKDWEDAAIESEGDEVLEDLGREGLHEIRMIDAALERIGAGTYGTCARCGDPISEERLDVLPFTPLCRSCAASA
ncbi:MAG: TraR/DksA family transcriptional regulator [Rubricella sp.]